jgi:nitrogen fixation/metabolism regulation signal transduction histidine kinase
MNKVKRALNRKLVVNPRLQIGIMAYTIAFITLVDSINLYCQTFLINNEVSSGMRVLMTSGVIFVTFVSAIVFGMILTNRIAGPIYRLRRHMSEVADGQHTLPINFRKNDYFSEIIPEYNKIIEKLPKG